MQRTTRALFCMFAVIWLLPGCRSSAPSVERRPGASERRESREQSRDKPSRPQPEKTAVHTPSDDLSPCRTFPSMAEKPKGALRYVTINSDGGLPKFREYAKG